jgi:hypothetical protein
MDKISLGFSFIIFVTLFCPFQLISIFEICKIKYLFVIKNIALYSMLYFTLFIETFYSPLLFIIVWN